MPKPLPDVAAKFAAETQGFLDLIAATEVLWLTAPPSSEVRKQLKVGQRRDRDGTATVWAPGEESASADRALLAAYRGARLSGAAHKGHVGRAIRRRVYVVDVALPLKTTADDVRNIVRYLKTKPTGATVTEAKAAVDKRLVDHRKLSAYRFWGIISRDNEKLKLADRGWLMARDPAKEQQVFREIIDAVTPYRSVLEWANHQQLATLTTVDVSVHWHEHHQTAVADANDNTLRENAVCFFNVMQAAEFGKLTIGRAGKPTRLDLSLTALQEHIEAGPMSPPWERESEPEPEPEPEHGEGDDDEPTPPPEARTPDQTVATPQPPAKPEPLRVFIAHGQNLDIVEQIETMLGLADFESEVAENEETTAIPVPNKVLDAMRRCQAGIIAVTVDEGRRDGDGNYVLNENVLIEIGAAFVLYERRVVLVWDKRLKVPSNLQGLYRCEFEGEELSWSTGMKLMKAIQGFKPPKP